MHVIYDHRENLDFVQTSVVAVDVWPIILRERESDPIHVWLSEKTRILMIAVHLAFSPNPMIKTHLEAVDLVQWLAELKILNQLFDIQGNETGLLLPNDNHLTNHPVENRILFFKYQSIK